MSVTWIKSQKEVPPYPEKVHFHTRQASRYEFSRGPNGGFFVTPCPVFPNGKYFKTINELNRRLCIE